MDNQERETFERWKIQRKKEWASHNKYNSKAYDRIALNVMKGYKDIIKDIANKRGYSSINSYINNLIDTDIQNYNNGK